MIVTPGTIAHLAEKKMVKLDHIKRAYHTGRSTPLVVFSLVLFCVGIASLSIWAMQPRYVALSSNVVESEHALILKELNRNGIRTRSNSAQNMIWVQESSLEKAQRVLHGFQTSADAMKSASQTSIHPRDLVAAESMLSRSISMIRGIQSASVHLTQDSQKKEDPSSQTASVMVRILPNSELSQEKVDSIASIVGAFQKIPIENVVISDNYGHLYRATPEEIRSVQNKMDYQQQMEKQHRQKLHNLLDSMVGAGKYSFVVNIDVNFLNRHSEKTEHKGDGYVIKQESNKGSPFAPDTTQTETVYNKTVTSEQQFQSDIKIITVAAFVELPIDASGKPAISKIEIEELIKTSIGYDPTRGDDVIVEVGKVVMRTNPSDSQPNLRQTVDSSTSQTANPGYYWGSMLGAFLIVVTGIILYRHWKSPNPSQPDPPSLSPERQQQIHSISAAVENDPDLLVKIISTWTSHQSNDSNNSDRNQNGGNQDDHNRAA